MRQEQASSLPPEGDPAAKDPEQWRRRMLFNQRERTALSNERKYQGWLRVSVGMATLGFVVERLELFLHSWDRSGTGRGMSGPEHPALLLTPLAVYGLAALTIGIATWDFLAERRRLQAEEGHRGPLLSVLVGLTVGATVGLFLLFWMFVRR